jgi:hypothetical protein
VKKVLEGPRADFSWGHLSVDSVERATEVFGAAVWEANDRVVADPNLMVRITIEAVHRPILPGSRWMSRVSGVPKIVDYITADGGIMYRVEGDGSGFCPRAEDWCRDNIWYADP